MPEQNKSAENEVAASTFIQLQYESVRKEVEAAQDRILKMVVGGVLLVPVAEYLDQVHDIAIVKFLLPCIVLFLFMLTRAQYEAMTRCARYVRSEIEPHFEPHIRGWETWLGTERGVYERAVGLAAAALFVLFYVVSAWISATVVVSGESNDPIFERANERLMGLTWFSNPELAWFAIVAGLYVCLAMVIVPLNEWFFYRRRSQNRE